MWKKPDSWIPQRGRTEGGVKERFCTLSPSCALPQSNHTRNPPLRQFSTLWTPWILPAEGGIPDKPGPDTSSGRLKVTILAKVAKRRNSSRKSRKEHFRTLLLTFVDSLGVLSGLWTILSLLFLNIPEFGPKPGRPKVTFLRIPEQARIDPILRQESQPYPGLTKPGPRAASRASFCQKVICQQ